MLLVIVHVVLCVAADCAELDPLGKSGGGGSRPHPQQTLQDPFVKTMPSSWRRVNGSSPFPSNGSAANLPGLLTHSLRCATSVGWKHAVGWLQKLRPAVQLGPGSMVNPNASKPSLHVDVEFDPDSHHMADG